jgi:erythromycin esterase-like protein
MTRLRMKATLTFALLASLIVPHAIASDLARAADLVRSEAGSHRLILLGEKHGTQEIPDLVAMLVSSYAAEGPVLLGLDVPRSEHAAFKRYLDSDGGPKAQGALRSMPFWQVQGIQHDGRRSHDMLDLVEHVRTLRASGHDIAILPYDIAKGDAPDRVVDPDARDRVMADVVRHAWSNLPRGRLLVLGGNVHAMLERPADAPPQMQTPMGTLLRDLDPYSVDIVARSGAFWACLQPCGPLASTAGTAVSGPVDGPFRFRVVLERFSVARLLGDTAHGPPSKAARP